MSILHVPAGSAPGAAVGASVLKPGHYCTSCAGTSASPAGASPGAHAVYPLSARVPSATLAASGAVHVGMVNTTSNGPGTASLLDDNLGHPFGSNVGVPNSGVGSSHVASHVATNVPVSLLGGIVGHLVVTTVLVASSGSVSSVLPATFKSE